MVLWSSGDAAASITAYSLVATADLRRMKEQEEKSEPRLDVLDDASRLLVSI